MDEHIGLGEGGLAVGIGQAAHVVAVEVGDELAVDLLGGLAGGLEVGNDVAYRRAEQLAGAGVDQHQLAPPLLIRKALTPV